MTTPSLRRFLSSASLFLSVVLLVASTALAKTVQVGTCLPSLQTYATISLAVAAVPPSSTIMVCPGNYPEQVTITQPLTLKGAQSGIAANPTIVVPSGGLTKSVATTTGNVYYQLVAENVASGSVNISNIGVNGSGNGLPASAPFVGVFYYNASGIASRLAIYNQTGTGAGYGVVAEGSSAATVSVLNCSIHDYDSGAVSIDGSVTGTIKSNVIVTSNSFSGSTAPDGIILYSSGTIANNRVTTHPQPPGISANTGITIESGVIVNNNSVENFTIGIWALGESDTVTANKVSMASAGVGLVVSGNNNDVERNSFTNLPNDGAGISFNCTGTGNTVIHNVVNDAFWGLFDTHSGNTTSPNTFVNVANISSGPC
jgi:Right handed beta helix region